MDFVRSHMGEILSLGAAFVWAFAVIMFKKSGERVHPLALNMFKNALATILFIPTVYIFGQSLFYHAPLKDYLLLAFSGVVGIAIADTLFFKSLNMLGAGLSSIVVCTYSPFVILLSVIGLNERLTLLQIIGSIMIISAVLSAMTKNKKNPTDKKHLIIGAVLGIFSQFLMALGIIAFKPILGRAPLVWVTAMRLTSGMIALLILFLLNRKKKEIILSLTHTGSWGYAISGSFLGAYIAMIFWLAGMKYTQASIAAVLNQTSNVFVFLLAWIFLKEAINLRRTVGIILAVIGAILVSMG